MNLYQCDEMKALCAHDPKLTGMVEVLSRLLTDYAPYDEQLQKHLAANLEENI